MADQDGNTIAQIMDRTDGTLRAVYPKDPGGRKIPFKAGGLGSTGDMKSKNGVPYVVWENVNQHLRQGVPPDPELFPTMDAYLDYLRLGAQMQDAAAIQKAKESGHPANQLNPKLNANYMESIIRAAQSGLPMPPAPADTIVTPVATGTTPPPAGLRGFFPPPRAQ
jgi:hypothetical protein